VDRFPLCANKIEVSFGAIEFRLRFASADREALLLREAIAEAA
jgi:hypothetical protein